MIVVHTCHQDRTFDAPAVPLHGKVAKFVVEQEPQAGLVELARVRLIPPAQRAIRRVSLGRLEDSVCYLFEILIRGECDGFSFLSGVLDHERERARQGGHLLNSDLTFVVPPTRSLGHVRVLGAFHTEPWSLWPGTFA